MSRPSFGALAPWMRITALTWVLLTSVLAVVNGAALLSLFEEVRQPDTTTGGESLARQLQPLEERLRTVETRREPPRVDHTDELIVLRQRIDAIEQALPENAVHAEAPALYARMEHLESKVGRLQRSSRAKRKAATAAKPPRPVPSAPSFVALGVELRGGERFVSVAPQNATSLDQVKLLRVGEAEAGWRLEAIERNRAVFRSSDQARSLPLP